MNERQLVSFGNYLLKRYGVKVHSTDGTNVPLYERSVDHADLCNWKETEDSLIIYSLPSRFQLGDKVSIRFKPYLVVDEGEIIKIHFSESKVLYDIQVKIPYLVDGVEVSTTYTRLYNVDSSICDEV